MALAWAQAWALTGRHWQLEGKRQTGIEQPGQSASNSHSVTP